MRNNRGGSSAAAGFSRESKAARAARACAIDDVLSEVHPDARCGLRYSTSFELLAATILSAQTTDEKVNEVTPTLFERFPSPARMAAASTRELETIVHPLGFFRSKARALREMADSVARVHGGVVPGRREDLVTLRGVGRKTANVVLGECFGVPAITVDTHVGRLSRRMGLSKAREPERVEKDLMALLPAARWTGFSHRMIWHGRRVCPARRPACDACPVASLCPQVL